MPPDGARERCAAAESAYRRYVENLPSRTTRSPRDKAQADQWHAEEARSKDLLAAWRAAIREWLGPVEVAPCSVPRPNRCSYQWTSDGRHHACALPRNHSGGTRSGSVDHACGCGAMIDPIEVLPPTPMKATQGAPNGR